MYNYVHVLWRHTSNICYIVLLKNDTYMYLLNYLKIIIIDLKSIDAYLNQFLKYMLQLKAKKEGFSTQKKVKSATYSEEYELGRNML